MKKSAEMTICPHCGMEYDYAQQKHCSRCDGDGCAECVSENSEPLCRECKFGSLPLHLEPMLAENGTMPHNPENWAFEYKWDGIRSLCYWKPGEMRFESRNMRDITLIYPDLLADKEKMPPNDLILDGEIITLDVEGRPSFKMLQGRMHLSPDKAVQKAKTIPVLYYIFDLLWLDGRSLLEEPYSERRRLLENLQFTHKRWRVPAGHVKDGWAMLRVARKRGLEGILAKRLESPYRPGIRSKDWMKIKLVKKQEFIIGGWEPREGNEQQIGALLVGYYTPENLKPVFAGRVGTGFNEQTHQMLVPMLKNHRQDNNPFTENIGHRNVQFTVPTLVAEVEYRRWPEGGYLQQASFQGIRNDVPAHDVRKET